MQVGAIVAYATVSLPTEVISQTELVVDKFPLDEPPSTSKSEQELIDVSFQQVSS